MRTCAPSFVFPFHHPKHRQSTVQPVRAVSADLPFLAVLASKDSYPGDKPSWRGERGRGEGVGVGWGQQICGTVRVKRQSDTQGSLDKSFNLTMGVVGENKGVPGGSAGWGLQIPQIPLCLRRKLV